MSAVAAPIAERIPYVDPMIWVNHFKDEPCLLFLDSANHVMPYATTNRYSYLMWAPFETIRIKNGVSQGHGSPMDPWSVLRDALDRHAMPRRAGLPPFQGGMAGLFAYDLLQYNERVPQARDDMAFPDLAVGLYDVVISFDHQLRCAWLVSTGHPELQLERQRSRALNRLREVKSQLLEASHTLPEIDAPWVSALKADQAPEQYREAVKTCQAYIRSGDIFEVNISQRFQATMPEGLTTLALYRRLREVNPAPFASFFQFDDMAIVSASPERFVSVSQGKVEVRPIKGTIPRGASPEEDAQYAKQLLASEKDRSENVMIVDLMRNDLSKVCEPHSVQVEQLCALESFSDVHHLVSTVVGTLSVGKRAVDVLAACFPGGSISGAPKVRAMEIIAALEPTARGPYCGSMGFIGFDGSMDLSILIRSFAISGRALSFQVGGAVVLASDPHAEYEESCVKARGLLRALLGEERVS